MQVESEEIEASKFIFNYITKNLFKYVIHLQFLFTNDRIEKGRLRQHLSDWGVISG